MMIGVIEALSLAIISWDPYAWKISIIKYDVVLWLFAEGGCYWVCTWSHVTQLK